MEAAQNLSIDRGGATVVCVLGELTADHLELPSKCVAQLLTKSPGGPGVGKGTQCVRLAADLGLVHISVGDLLREEAESSSPARDFHLETVMKTASLVPYHHVRNTLNNCLLKHVQNGRTRFLIDGFPRSKEQAQFFDQEEGLSTAALRELTHVIAGMECKGSSPIPLL